jgi:hypothetical protein
MLGWEQLMGVNSSRGEGPPAMCALQLSEYSSSPNSFPVRQDKSNGTSNGQKGVQLAFLPQLGTKSPLSTPVGRGDPIMARFLAWYYLWKEALVFNSDSIGM